MLIRANDTVEVIAGDDRGTRGKVLRIERAVGKVVVEGVNRVYKHVRRSQRNPQGGRLSMEMAMPLSNVALVCQACGKAVRVGARYLPDGSKERFCRKCGAGNGRVAPPKARYAKTRTNS
jgi:large subunit ribosomal protein L24